jgi:hypothetical protein
MLLLAYIDVRPFLFIVGLPLFVGLSLLIRRLAGVRFRKVNVALTSALVFAGLFVIFLTGFGPFIGRKKTREHLMAWEIKPSPSNGMKQSEVVLSFVDFPGHHIGEFSDELATHLRDRGEQPVKVVFEVTLDYGRMRGIQPTDVAGFREWESEWGYSGSSGSPVGSPWD